MRPLDAIALRLANQGVVASADDVFLGTDVDVPPGTAPILSVIESGGQSPFKTHNAGTLKLPDFQIVARGDIYPDVAILADLAYNALGGNDPNGLKNLAIGDFFFLWIRPKQEPFSLPLDANGRVRVAFNIESCRR